jgi:uncharacterized Ntn-hydrolase superfamily protein
VSVPRSGTFSIVAADPETGEVGVAVQSKYFAVGAVVPWARAGVGAAATQAAVVAAYGPRLLDALERGSSPEAAIDEVLSGDEGRETRQLGVATAAGDAACWTGSDCNPWAGHERGSGFAAQGNILAGADVVRAMARTYETTVGTMAERLVAALEAGQAAGGDTRGQQSAAVLVEKAGAGEETGQGVDRAVDLRVDDHPEPIRELRRLLDLHARGYALVRAHAEFSAGRVEAAIAVLDSALERFPDEATALYNLACYESLSGKADDALGHLELALEHDPSLGDLARGDVDLDPLRTREDFARLLGT